MNINEKLNSFTSHIIETAQNESNAILEEIKKEKQAELLQAENDLLEVAYRKIQEDVAKIQAATASELSKKSLELKKLIYSKKIELTEKLFLKLKEKIEAFTKSEQYVEYLEKIIDEAVLRLNDDSFEAYFSKNDYKIAELLKKKHTKASFFEGNFEMGGIILVFNEKKVKINNVFDEKFKVLKARGVELE